jgi:hypothetical protein
MTIAIRFAAAFALSFAAAGAAQQWTMATYDSAPALDALPPLAVCILLITAVFGLVTWRRPSAIGRTVGVMLIAILVFGASVYILGKNSMSPGIGGNIGYMMAMLIDFYFLLPAALAVPIHWWLLRGKS